MPSPNARSPWKVLIFAVLICTVCFVLAVGGLAYWFLSVTGLHRGGGGGGARPRVEQREDAAPWPAPVVVEGDDAVPIGTNSPSGAPRRSTLPPKKIVPSQAGNAILTRPDRDVAQPGDDIFREIVVPELEIEISMEATVRLTMNPRTYVPVNIREGEQLYKNVALRLKGGPGSFQRLQQTPSFTINFDKYVPGQTFHGLKKIHLNSSVQDRTWLHEKISRELFEAAGVPVPRAGHAIVTFKGRDPRLYVLLEGVNKQFLKRYFKNAKGNVYDGHSGTDVNNELPINSGDEATVDRTRLRDLARAARVPDRASRLRQLEEVLDLDRFISFMAMEMMLSHWDGYTMGVNNYRIAHNLDTDRMVFVPHGLDQVLGNRTGSLMSPQARGQVARAVLEIPEAKRRYQARVAELTTNVFRSNVINQRIREVVERLAGALEEVNPGQAKEFRNQIGPALCRTVERRAASLEREANPAMRPSPLNLDPFASATLTNAQHWTAKIDLGEPRLTREQDEQGNLLLYIGSTNGCTASWRTTVALRPGKYRFEGRMKTRGVILDPSDPRAGAGLRISRHRIGQKNGGDHDWRPVSFEFEVGKEEGDGSDKELICELRADRGEIWYDLNSLQLKRL